MSNMVSTSTNMQSRSMELSVGVEKERVAATTLAVIQALFGERGIEFLSLILRQAVVKQLSLETLDITDVAVIQVPNLRTLASRMGWCYDAVDKYVLLFTALLLLRKQRSRHGGTELHFPLVEYRLPDQSETKLSKLYQMRPKVASLARKVVSRLAILTSPLTQKEPDSPRVAEERLLF